MRKYYKRLTEDKVAEVVRRHRDSFAEVVGAGVQAFSLLVQAPRPFFLALC